MKYRVIYFTKSSKKKLIRRNIILSLPLKLNAEPIQDDKNKGAEDEDFINQKKQDAEEQASGVHSDGGGGNCPEGQIWNAETETCVPVEGAGSVDKDVSKGSDQTVENNKT